MKIYKLAYLSLLFTLFSLLSCTNNEPAINNPEVTESAAARTSMSELQSHFESNGSLRPINNPTGNILFDFCFDFEYPITLSYNTGISVTVNDFNGLAAVLVNMTDTLYINGIVFPFNVTVFNQDTNSIVVQTIVDETAFETLINSCGFDDVATCNCYQEFNPVCIEINDENGDTFTLQFPNLCIASCEGFTQEDIVACDDIVDPGIGNIDCFNFVYPLSIVSYDSTTLTIESDDDWETAMFTMMGAFDFVYPFHITLENGNDEVIANAEEFVGLLDTCYDTANPCDCTEDYAPVCVEINGEITEFTNMCFAECYGFTQADIVNCNSSGDCTINNLTVEIGDCNDDGTYNLTINFDTNQPEDYVFILNFEEYNNTDNVFSISELPVTIYNIEVWSEVTNLEVYMSNLCSEDIYFDTPNCEDYGCWTFIFPVTIIADNEPYTINNQNELDFLMSDYSTSSLSFEYPFNVAFDGFNLTIENDIDFYEIGKWDNICD